eukprot:10254443-Alexandrium_andersonii.AAC.1
MLGGSRQYIREGTIQQAPAIMNTAHDQSERTSVLPEPLLPIVVNRPSGRRWNMPDPANMFPHAFMTREQLLSIQDREFGRQSEPPNAHTRSPGGANVDLVPRRPPTSQNASGDT